MNAFQELIESDKYGEAITILASDKSMQTNENIVLCCKSPDLAFNLIRFVPSAKQISAVIALAAKHQRYARLIFEDIPELRSTKLFIAAVGDDHDLATSYISRFDLSNEWLQLLKQDNKHSQRQPEALL